MSAGYLILSDSTPKIELVSQNIVAFDYIKRVEFLSTGIEFGLYHWLILIDNLRTLITVLRDSILGVVNGFRPRALLVCVSEHAIILEPALFAPRH